MLPDNGCFGAVPATGAAHDMVTIGRVLSAVELVSIANGYAKGVVFTA